MEETKILDAEKKRLEEETKLLQSDLEVIFLLSGVHVHVYHFHVIG